MMKRLLQINESLNQGSTGRIAELIGNLARDKGWDVWIAHSSRSMNPSEHKSFIISNLWEVRLHAIQTRLFDTHGLGCTSATRRLIHKIKELNPDIIHLHLVHGYYLNYRILFDYLKEAEIPVVWTLHDCWTFTGHCAFFDFYQCNKWEHEECRYCKHKETYPSSVLISASHKNFITKREAFTSIANNLTLVPVSYWLEGVAKRSFLDKCDIKTIHNGVNTSVFSPCSEEEKATMKRKLGIADKKIIMGCAVPWVERKGYSDFYKLRLLLPDEYVIIMIGMNAKQKRDAEKAGIVGVVKTESQKELATFYSMADVFINPTYEDNFPTTHLEALACGTPVITYNTGGSPESITEETGCVVAKADINGMAEAIKVICNNGKSHYEHKCRSHAVANFDSMSVYSKYIDLYNEILDKNYKSN